jgi:signal transduction histidine kinase
MLSPLDDIRTGALRFGAGDFGTPIPVAHSLHPEELAELAKTINTMGADIHEMLEAKRSLLLAISHELRSPLTRARLNTELLPETPDVKPNREALLRDLALMRDLVTDLLESERLTNPGAGEHAALHRESVNLCELVRDEVMCLPGSPVVTQELAYDMVDLSVDPTRVRLLVRNLLDNALRHSTNIAKPPTISVAPDGSGGALIAVRDFGPGVPDEQLPNLGQAFYRPDAARTREDGGVGLGLYLCKLVAQAHGGGISVRNAQPGLEVQVVLPRGSY